MEHSNFYPLEKTLHQDGNVTRVYDEPWTAQTWREIQVSMIFLFYSALSNTSGSGSPTARRCWIKALLFTHTRMARRRPRFQPRTNAPNGRTAGLDHVSDSKHIRIRRGIRVSHLSSGKISCFAESISAYERYTDCGTRRYGRSTAVRQDRTCSIEDGYFSASVQHCFQEDMRGFVERAGSYLW
jgi:hypothetical protein